MSPGFLKHSQYAIKTTRSVPRSLFALILTVLPLALGVWLVAIVVVSHLPHLRHDYSVPVRAQVVESRLESARRPLFSQVERVFVYRYFHEGQLFRASAYRPGGHLDEAIRSHPTGSVLTAYLDPDAPRFSMVWPGLARDQAGDLALGLVLIVIGVTGFNRRLLRKRAGARQ